MIAGHVGDCELFKTLGVQNVFRISIRIIVGRNFHCRRGSASVGVD